MKNPVIRTKKNCRFGECLFSRVRIEENEENEEKKERKERKKKKKGRWEDLNFHPLILHV